MKPLRCLRVTPLYIDRSVVVVNKPAGIISQASNDIQVGDRNTSNYLQLLKDQLELEGGPWPVHRLDKATTGAFLLARSPTQSRVLQTQFKTKEVEKTYLALVRGGEKSFPGKSGQLRDVFRYGADGRFDRILPVGAENDVKLGKMKLAETHWEVLGTSPKAPLSLVKLNLITGMKHQLRIHMAKLLQTPILGDSLYSRSETSPSITKVTYIPKDMYLHASHISFFKYRETHPHKRFRLGVTAPLPRNFRHLCSKFDIPLPQDVVEGGLFINGVKLTDPADTPEGGRWLGNSDDGPEPKQEKYTIEYT